MRIFSLNEHIFFLAPLQASLDEASRGIIFSRADLS